MASLLDAAAELFIENGGRVTSVGQVAERAGIAKSTFYHYFSDRTAMREALRKRYSEHFATHVDAAIEAIGPDDWEKRLAAWTSATVDAYLTTIALHNAIFHDPDIRKRFRITEQPFIINLASLLCGGTKSGTWSVEDPSITSAFMFCGLQGLLDDAIARGADAAQLTICINQIFVDMLQPSIV